MPTYNVSLRYDFEVYADNEKEAIEKARKECNGSQISIVEDVELLD